MKHKTGATTTEYGMFAAVISMALLAVVSVVGDELLATLKESAAAIKPFESLFPANGYYGSWTASSELDWFMVMGSDDVMFFMEDMGFVRPFEDHGDNWFVIEAPQGNFQKWEFEADEFGQYYICHEGHASTAADALATSQNHGDLDGGCDGGAWATID
jgi:Flp pilus assembly pilin Flp